MQEYGFACPVEHGGRQHAVQHGTFHLPVLKPHNGEQSHKHGEHTQHHHRVSGTHLGFSEAGGQRAEEVAHGIERTACFRIHTHIGPEPDVHEHEADGRPDAQADAQRNGVHDFFTHIQDGKHQEHNAFHQNDHHCRLE